MTDYFDKGHVDLLEGHPLYAAARARAEQILAEREAKAAKRAGRVAQSSAPVCVFCHRSEGVQFAIFTPRFQPFGTACVECERTLPAGTTVPPVQVAQ